MSLDIECSECGAEFDSRRTKCPNCAAREAENERKLQAHIKKAQKRQREADQRELDSYGPSA